MYEIQKKAPVPKIVRAASAVKRKYPFAQLGVDEFFFIPNRKKNNMSAHASNTGKQLDRKFTTRLAYMVEAGEGVWVPCDEKTPGAVLGIGVWRVE